MSMKHINPDTNELQQLAQWGIDSGGAAECVGRSLRSHLIDLDQRARAIESALCHDRSLVMCGRFPRSRIETDVRAYQEHAAVISALAMALADMKSET